MSPRSHKPRSQPTGIFHLGLKVRSKKPSKPRSKKKDEVEDDDVTDEMPEVEEGPVPVPKETIFVREFVGLLICAAVLVVLIGLVSHWVMGGDGNILGPVLGSWASIHLINTVGSLPSFLLLTTGFFLGVSFIRWRDDRFPFGVPLTLFGLLFFSLLLLSIRYIDHAEFTAEDYQLSGGYIGNFLVQTLYVPIFGRSIFGPYLISLLGLAFTIIWGFKLGISQIMEKFGEFMGIMVYPIFDGFSKTRDKNKIPANTNLNLVTDTNEVDSNALTDSAEMQNLSATESPSEMLAKKQRRSRAATGVDSADVVKSEIRKSRDTSIEKFELPENLEDADPLVIRKLRDKEAEIRRVAELNDWETQSRDPEIGGMIKKKARAEVDTDRIASNKDVKPIPTVNEEEAVKVPVVEGTEEVDAEEAPALSVLPHRPSHDGSAHYANIPIPVTDSFDTYKVPSFEDVFKNPPIQKVEYTEADLKAQAQLLEEQLANFRVMGKVVGICTGPVIIRYEVELAPGVKVSQISGLSDDLALALKAKSIRILTPIPGKSAVGIEVPNRKAQVVYIKDVLRSPSFKPEPETIKLILGQDIAGEPMVMDLTKAPHLLIAGQTGSGKSVCINSFMASILFSKTPDEVRMILVDPKVVELKPYENIPHLLAPVVTQPEIAVQALKWSTYEMDRRYEVLAKAGVRNIKGYNQKFNSGLLPETIPEDDRRLMPRIVIVIDELADLMMVAGKEVETSIARIAQKARAVGIHLILATQRPSTNVITGTIKANLPTRVAFQVASQIDARTIMDKAGSEKLLGRGDMLFRSIDSPEPDRIHGAFVDDEEAEFAAKAASEQNVCYPQIPSFEVSGGELEQAEEEAGAILDAKFREAAELVVSLNQASVSLLQRRMAIGYARSGRLVDQLEKSGIVGKDRGSKPREVLMDEVELLNYFEIHNL